MDRRDLENHPILFPYFQNEKLRHGGMRWFFHGGLVVLADSSSYILTGFFFHAEKELSTKEETKRSGSSLVLQGQSLNRTFIDLPHLSDSYSTNQPEPAAEQYMSLVSSVFTLPGHRTLLHWDTAWKGWPRAAQTLLGLPSSVQNSSTISPRGTKSHLGFLKQTDMRATGHKREFLVGDSLGQSRPAPSGYVTEPQEPCPRLHWVRGSSRAQTLEKESSRTVTKNPGPLWGGWKLENAHQHHLGWEKEKELLFPPEGCTLPGKQAVPRNDT